MGWLLPVLQRAKRGGHLESIDLEGELYTSFTRAMSAPGAATLAPPTSPFVHHGLLSVLHPWSQRLEDLKLDDVNAALTN